MFVAVKLSIGAFMAVSKSGTSPFLGVPGPATGESRPEPDADVDAAITFFAGPLEPAFDAVDLVFIEASSSLQDPFFQENKRKGKKSMTIA